MESVETEAVDLSSLVTEVEQVYEQAKEALQKEEESAQVYLTDVVACRRIWEDNSTIVPHFEQHYRKYVASYAFRDKCGKIAEQMAEAIGKLEKKYLKKQTLPLQKVEISFPSLWTERIFDCLQKKRENDDIWNHMGDALWEETRSRVQEEALKKMHQEAEICRQGLKKIKELELQALSAQKLS